MKDEVPPPGGSGPPPDWRQFSLEELQALVVLLAERNVTKAGRRLGKSESATSDTLKRLQEKLHDPLLIKIGREMVPTPLLESLGPAIQSVLEDLEFALQSGRRLDPRTFAYEFRLIAPDYVTDLMTPPLMRRVREEFPMFRLRISTFSSESADQLLRGNVRGVLGPAGPLAWGCLSQSLFSDRWLCAVASDHPDLLGDTPDLDRYLELPYLRVDASLGDPREKLRPLRPPELVVPAFSSVPAALQGSRMTALLPEKFARCLVQISGALRLFSPPFPVPDLEFALHWHTRDHGHPPHRMMRKLLTEIARGL